MKSRIFAFLFLMTLAISGNALAQIDDPDYGIGGGGGGCFSCTGGFIGNAVCSFFPARPDGFPAPGMWTSCTVMGYYCLTSGQCWQYVSTRAGKEKAISSTLAVLQLLKVPVDDLIANAPEDPDERLAAYLAEFVRVTGVKLQSGQFPIPPEAKTPAWWRT